MGGKNVHINNIKLWNLQFPLNFCDSTSIWYQLSYVFVFSFWCVKCVNYRSYCKIKSLLIGFHFIFFQRCFQRETIFFTSANNIINSPSTDDSLFNLSTSYQYEIQMPFSSFIFMQFDECKEAEFKFFLCKFPFFCIHQRFFLINFFFFSSFQSVRGDGSWVAMSHARLLPLGFLTSWTFVNYYVFIAIQFDSVIYGFITFSFFFFLTLVNWQSKPFINTFISLSLAYFSSSTRLHTFSVSNTKTFETIFFVLVWNCVHR